MQKFIGIGLFFVCIVTSVTAVIFQKDATRYRAELASAQAAAIKLQQDLAMRTATVRVYEPSTVASPDEPLAPAMEPTDETDSTALANRVRELELELQTKNQHIAALQQARQEPPAPDQRQQRNGQNWEEELKKNDPERYKEMIKQREEARSKVQRSFAEKADHFLKQDTSAMTEDEAIAHEEMLAVLENTWALAEQLQSDTPRDQRWQIMRQMRDNMTILEPSLKEERTKQWYQLSTELGYTGDDATAFVNYLDKIVDVTSMTDIYQTMRRGRFSGGNSNTNTPSR